MPNINLRIRKKWLFALMAIYLALSGCSKKQAPEAEPVIPVQVSQVGRASIQRIVTADGILYPRNQANVMPKISAPVRAVYVNRGDHVGKGQLLAVLENRDLAAAAAETKGLYEQAEASYRTTTAASVPEEVTKAQMDVDATKQALEAAQKLYESRQALFREGALARRQVDEAGTAYAQTRSQYEIARKHLESVQKVSRQELVKSAQAQLDAAKGRYQGAEAQLAYSQVRSPIDGVVTDRPVYPGEMASSGSPLLTVMDITRVIARANIPEREAAFLKVGSQATITASGETAQGKVTVVSPAVNPNTTTVEVWVEAPNPGERLKPGVTVRVSIVAETVNDTIVIPTAALLPSPDGSAAVMVVGNDSLAHERKIELGIREPDKVQVLKGLTPGEQVVTVGVVGLQDNAKVRMEKASS